MKKIRDTNFVNSEQNSRGIFFTIRVNINKMKKICVEIENRIVFLTEKVNLQEISHYVGLNRRGLVGSVLAY